MGTTKNINRSKIKKTLFPKMGFLAPIGRLMFVAIFIGSSIHHLTKPEEVQVVMAKHDFPEEYQIPALYAGCACAVAGALAFVIGYTGIGGLLLLAFLGPVTFFIHVQGFLDESAPEAERQLEMTMLMKNMAMIGVCIMHIDGLLFGSKAGGKRQSPANQHPGR